jgi:hypothetical protein
MFKKSYFFLLSLVLMYGLIPLYISYFVGSDFLIGDFVDEFLIRDLFVLTLGSAFFLSPMLKNKFLLPKFNSLGKLATNTGFKIYLTYTILLVLLGSYLRFIGTDRANLLDILSLTFVQGMGFILIMFYIKFINSNRFVLSIVSLIFVIIDMLFMGKQYFISLVIILVFLADLREIKIKFLHLILFFTISIFFIFIINLSRGDFSRIDMFSSLMEFRGVLSSIQFAKNGTSFFDLTNFRASVEANSINNFGYNLAFHPLMYFRSLSSNTILVVTFYSFLVFTLFKCMIRIIGSYAVLIFSLNFIHFLRHGIDIFLIKVFFQFLILFIFRLNFNTKSDITSNNPNVIKT